MQPFWMIHGIGQREPRARHLTEDDALREAKRLARANPDVEFIVLRSTHRAITRDVVVTTINDPPLQQSCSGRDEHQPF